MSAFSHINGIGDVYIPTQFREFISDNAPLKLFTNEDLGQLDRIFNHLRRSGVPVLSGDWVRILQVIEYTDRKKAELIPRSTRPKGKRNVRRSKAQEIVSLMCWADEHSNLQIHPPPNLPDLLELVGENPGANEGRPFLIPIVTLQQIQNALAETYPIRALGMELTASENVLPPRSQETIELFQRGMQSAKIPLPSGATVLDMGCGCGCLTLLAAQELSDRQVNIYASDLLSEAVATTRLNIQRFADSQRWTLPPIQVMPPGDLFDSVRSLQTISTADQELEGVFDLIIFNAPWIVSRARNRLEVAIHDERQGTLRRFFQEAPKYLKTQGRLLLGYADASGPKVITSLERIIEDAGLTIANCFKERVATHRSKRKWQNIMVYEMVESGAHQMSKTGLK